MQAAKSGGISAPGWEDSDLLDFLVSFNGVVSRASRRWVLGGDTLALAVRGLLPVRGRPWTVYVEAGGGLTSSLDVDGTEVRVVPMKVSGSAYDLGTTALPRSWVFEPHIDDVVLPGGWTRFGARAMRVRAEWPYMLNVPARPGSVLDTILPEWFTKVAVAEKETGLGVFFTPERKAVARAMIRRFYEIAGEAGMRERLWLGFGGVLGLLRDGDFIQHDDDIDMCIHGSDTGEAERRYLELVSKPGSFDGKVSLFEHRKRQEFFGDQNGQPVWFSCGPISPAKGGVKACHWFGWNYNGMWWHSKGVRWVNGKKFGRYGNKTQSAAALALGMPVRYCEDLIDVDFKGVRVRVPRLSGHCVDFWYPGWVTPRAGGSSAQRHVLAIGNWADKKTWKTIE